MAENLGTIQLVAALRPGPLGPRRLARAVGRQRPMVLTILTNRAAVGAIEDRCVRLESIRHPALGRVRAVIRYQGGLAMVEDTVDGVPLSVILEHGALPQSAAVGLMRRVFRALHIGWNRTDATPPDPGLVHGDLHPEQIWIEPGAKVKVLGIGTVLGQARSEDLYRPQEAGRSPYCAPECLTDEEFHTSDVYSAAAILGALITGRAPGHSSIDPEWHESVIQSMEHRLQQRGCHLDLQALISKCLSLRPSDRPTAVEMGKALETLQNQLIGPKKEEWCADVIPGLVSLSRGDDSPGGTDATPSFQTLTGTTPKAASDDVPHQEEATDPRAPRPPPLISPQDAPGYSDIQVDPHTGEVSWGSEISGTEEYAAVSESGRRGVQPLDEQPTEEMRSPMELIPPSWVLEEEDDETDEVERIAEADTDKVVQFDEEDSLEVPIPSIPGPEMGREPLGSPPALESVESADDLEPATELSEWTPIQSSESPVDAHLETDVQWRHRDGRSHFGRWALVALLLLGILTVMWSEDDSQNFTASKVSADSPERLAVPNIGTPISRGSSSTESPTGIAHGASVSLDSTPVRMDGVVVPDIESSDSTSILAETEQPTFEPSSVSNSGPTRSTSLNAPRLERQPIDTVSSSLGELGNDRRKTQPEMPTGSEPNAQVESNVESDSDEEPVARLLIDMDEDTGLSVVDSGLGHLLNGQEIKMIAGTIVLEAFFGGGTEFGTQYEVQLGANETVTIRCRADFQRCTCSPRNACSVR